MSSNSCESCVRITNPHPVILLPHPLYLSSHTKAALPSESMPSPAARMTNITPKQSHFALEYSPSHIEKLHIHPGTRNTHYTLLTEKVDALIALVDTLTASQEVMAASLEGAMAALVGARGELWELRGVELRGMMTWSGDPRADGSDCSGRNVPLEGERDTSGGYVGF
jgi:hypothetical protein